MELGNEVRRLITDTLAGWTLAAKNFADLAAVEKRSLSVGLCHAVLQHNAARIASTTAKIDAETLKSRKCFLCEENISAEQPQLPWDGGRYFIRINPYPIFDGHLVISAAEHVAQRLGERIKDMLRLCEELPEYTLFYNGAYCGASAPDHMHFQASPRGGMPIESDCAIAKQSVLYHSDRKQTMLCSCTDDLERFYYQIDSADIEGCVETYLRLEQLIPRPAGADEPWVNVISFKEDGWWHVLVFPRYCTRPHCYFGESLETALISPASVEMGGLLILPRKEDFERFTITMAKRMFREVSMSEEECAQVAEAFRHIELKI